MSENSKIEWTDHTFNPWSGCVKVSPACQHCYAAALPPAYRRNAVWGARTDRMPASDSYWAQPLAWDRKARKEGVRRRVFCASTADVFEDRADLDPLRERLWELIKQTPNLDWLLLTKRPEVMFKWSQSHPWPSNAWAGTTVESQEWADRRVPELRKVPAHVRFLSCEPLLGGVVLQGLAPGESMQTDLYREWLTVTGPSSYPYRENGGIHWVIAGGESGPNARPSHPDWFRSLRDQCQAAGVPFHFKQWGEWCAKSQTQTLSVPHTPSNEWSALMWDGELSEPTTVWNEYDQRDDSGQGARMRKIGKANAGRLLDGIEHNEFPEVA